MNSEPESVPVTGISPASTSWGKEKYAQMAEALRAEKIKMGSPTSSATSIAKVKTSSAMIQVGGERASEALPRHQEIIISLKSGLVVVITPSTMSENS